MISLSPQLALFNHPSPLCTTTQLKVMIPTPETTFQYKRPLPAHWPTVTTAATAARTTGFGNGCNPLQSSRRCTTPSLTQRVLLPLAIPQHTKSRKLLLPRRILMVLLTLRLAPPTLICNQPYCNSPFQLQFRLTFQLSRIMFKA